MTRRTLVVAGALALVPGVVHAQVTWERLRRADREPESWLTYSGSYSSQRFSRLAQVDTSNVGRLVPRWMHQLVNTNAESETTPIVADGVMYVTEARSAVAALDLRTGRTLWRWVPTLPRDLRNIGFPQANRGVAILDSTVFVGTLDARLVALDARSGAVRWTVQVGDNALGYALTLAPLAIRGKVLVGTSGGEAGIRGFVDAYDARDGRRLWRFYTIPGPGEPGHETWTPASWQTGGGATWLTGSYDPDLDLVYWGVGNPGPDWNDDNRPGDNLYTCSLVALDAQTGALRWHFQFTPHDTHDWDANQIPVLVDAMWHGRPRKLVAMANRNAFFYVLDRVTGEYLAGTEYARQTWARGLDARGRPVAIAGLAPSDSGTLVYPSLQGATNWMSPAYSPGTGMFYVPVREMGAVYFKREVTYRPGDPFMGGGERALDNDSASGAIRALDLATGTRKWNFPLRTPLWSGVLATAGGLVFAGSAEGRVYALHARTGALLWDFQAGGPVRAAPVTFLIDGRQHVAVAARNVILVFGLPSGPPPPRRR